MRLFIDARKLRHGGIGRYIENLLIGLSQEPNLELWVVCGSNEDRKSLKILGCNATCFVDSSNQYSLKEYFLFPLKYKKYIDLSDWYISPHYTLPFFISSKKLVVIHDCIHVTYPDSIFHRLLGRFLINSAINRADKVLTVSEASKDSLKKEFGEKGERINVINNSLLPLLNNRLPSKKNVEQGALRLLFVGSDRAHKRLGIFLEFLAQLKESKFDFYATIVSDLKEESSQFLEKNNLLVFTEVLSNLSNQELLEVYKCADFLICTSAEEGFCLPLLEAMSLGLSVIAPRKSFSEELLSDAGWYFESGSVADLFRVFVQALSEVELRNKKIQIGLKKAEDYSVASKANEFLEYLKVA